MLPFIINIYISSTFIELQLESFFCFVFNRSSTDESPIPESSSKPSDETTSSIPTTQPSVINFSSLAKPFEKTDNSHRLRETISTTEKLPTAPRRSSQVTNHNNNVEVVRPKSRNNKKVSVTSGFSIRRNPNNTNNPYTLTVLTRPFDDFDKARRQNNLDSSSSQVPSDRYYYDSSSKSNEASVEPVADSNSRQEQSSESSMRRNDFVRDYRDDDDDIPVYVRPTTRSRNVKSRTRGTTVPTTTSTKYYTSTNRPITKRPLPFLVNNQDIVDSTENAINTESLIEAGLQNVQNDLSSLSSNDTFSEPLPTRGYNRPQNVWNEPAVSPYKTLDNLRNTYRYDDNQDHTSSTTTPSTTTTTTTSTTTTTPSTTTTRIRTRQRNPNKQSRTKPSYYSYRLEDEVIPDQTTEIFNGKVKNVIKAFLNNFVSSSEPQFVEEYTTTTTPKPTTPFNRNEDDVVNIGYQKKANFKFVDEKPLRSNIKRLQIITEPTESRYIAPTSESVKYTEDEKIIKDFPSTSSTMTTMSSTPFTYANLPTTPLSVHSTKNDFKIVPSRESQQSKFSNLITSRPSTEGSLKFKKIVEEAPSTESNNQVIHYNDEKINQTESNAEDNKVTTEAEQFRPSDIESDIASTTSTTKATTTVKIEPTTSTTKSISFPTRASRVNPAIKLAATNPGGGRRSYQSSSKCSSDNSLQANPKCNEIKYQRYKYSPASSLSSLKLSHIYLSWVEASLLKCPFFCLASN